MGVGIRLVLIAVICCGFSGLAAAETRVVVKVVDGTAVVVRSGSAEPVPATPGMQLRSGDRFRVISGGAELEQDGRVFPVPLGADYVCPPEEGGFWGRLATRVKDLVGPGQTEAAPVCPEPTFQPSPRSPANSQIGSEAPVFRWAPVTKARVESIEMKSLDGSWSQTAPVSGEGAWSPSQTLMDSLKTGQWYCWRVRFRPEAAEAAAPTSSTDWVAFRRMSEAEMAAVEMTAEAIRKVCSGKSPALGELAAAVLYEDVGMRQRAEEILERLTNQPGGDHAARDEVLRGARILLAKVKGQRASDWTGKDALSRVDSALREAAKGNVPEAVTAFLKVAGQENAVGR
ncbi:MAG: hypothetical protein HY814_09860 [Candidatus Riflebacteria bacterium]|nr:hypothetical protein [Candidatus Riflebacteria bacterium]